jgi:DNA-binding response OmpR family regulator
MIEQTQAVRRSTEAAVVGRVLVVDDEPDVANLISEVLREAGFAADVCTRSRDALELFRKGMYDLVVLDIMMPALDGINLCLEIRRESEVPIIFLSARSDTPDRIIGLRAGADDYLPKPFSNDELVVRVERILRRSRPERTEAQRRFGALIVDDAAMQAVWQDQVLPLTPTEFRLLRTLSGEPGRVFSRDELLSRVWNYVPGGDTRLVDVHIGRLRKKLERAGVSEARIETARGFGYRLLDLRSATARHN